MKAKLLLLFLAFSHLAICQIPTTNLHSSYEFTNGSLVNGQGTGDFTQTGSALTQTNDRFTTTNNALDLNGDYLTRTDIDFPNDASNYGNEATISFWVKTTTNDANVKTIFDDTLNRSSAGDTTWSGYYVYLKDGKIGFNFRIRRSNGNSFPYVGNGFLSPTLVNDGLWHHVSFVIYSTHASVHSGGSNNVYTNTATTFGVLYIDGIPNGNAADVGAISSNGPSVLTVLEPHDSAGNITIANNRTNNLPSNNRYQDEIDDIHVYTRNLTAAEILQLSNDGNYCFYPPSPAILSVTGITHTTATINISETGTFDVAYHKTDEPFSAATIVNNVSSGSLNITGLDVFKEYNVFIRKQCVNQTTSWSSWPITFKTTRDVGRIYVNANATGNNNGISWGNAYTGLEDALSNMEVNEEIWVAQGIYTPVNTVYKLYNISTNGTKVYGGFNGTETLLTQRDALVNQTILSGDISGNDDANVTFNNATRSENSPHVIYVFAADNVLIDGVTVTSGYADATDSSVNRYGAGILLGNNTLNFSLKNTIIKDNVAYWGSGLASTGFSGNSNITIENCTFDNNLCSALGSTFYLIPPANSTMDVTVANCLLKNNKTSDNGSRIGNGASAGHIRAYNSGSIINATIVNNTIVNNSNEGSGTSDFATFGLSNASGGFGTVNIANNIFWGNTKNGGASATAFGKVTDANMPSATTIYNCIDDDNFSNFTNKVATSNANPLFTDAANNDFTLQTGSPAIDAGDNSKMPSSVTTDLTGGTRINNTTVDFGVYEFGNVLSVSTYVNKEITLKIYPNPVKNILNILMDESLEKIEVYNLLGQKVLETNELRVNTSQLQNGMYLLKVYAKNGQVGLKKFLKQ